MTKENLNLQLMESKLVEWREKIEELETKAQLMTEEDESEIDQHFDYLRDCYQDLEDHLAKLKTSGKEREHDLKSGLELRWDNLIQEFEQLAAKFQ